MMGPRLLGAFLIATLLIIAAVGCRRSTPTPTPTATTPAPTVTTPRPTTPAPTPTTPAPTPTTPRPTTPVPTPTPGPAASLLPATQQAAPGSTFTMTVQLNPYGRTITAGEVMVKFDASKLEVTRVDAGTILGSNPLVAVNDIDNTAGTILVAYARRGTASGPTPEGAFITFGVMVKSGASGRATVSIERVGLADGNFQDVPGVSLTTGSIITIG